MGVRKEVQVYSNQGEGSVRRLFQKQRFKRLGKMELEFKKIRMFWTRTSGDDLGQGEANHEPRVRVYF